MKQVKTPFLLPFFFFGLLIATCFSSLHAQSGHANFEIAGQIKQDTLLLLADSVPTPYQAAMKEAMEKYWTYSPFRIIPEQDRDLYCKPGYAFMARYRIKTSRSLFFIGIVLPGKDSCDWNKMEMKAYSYVSFDTEKINGHAIRAVQFIQNYLKQVPDKGKEKTSLDKTCSLCNAEMKSIQQKWLLINDGDLENELADSVAVAKQYKYPFKMAGREEISNAMIEQRSDVAYLMNFIDDNGRTFRLVVQAKDSKIIYCEHTLDNEIFSFSKKNLRDLSR